MSYSQAAICNIALGHLGISASIDDLEADESTNGQVCRTHFDIALDMLLRAHWWPFARREQELAVVAGYSSAIWAYAFRAPSDYLLGRGINLTAQDAVGDEFEVGGDSSGTLILTDVEEATLVYTAKVANTGLYPPAFIDCLSWGLACRIAQPLSADESYRATARTEYRKAVAAAMTNIGNEQIARAESDGAFVAAREVLSAE
jgi:hypothetical protein